MSVNSVPIIKFSSNCREELGRHVKCVKIFLEESVKFGTSYNPGTGKSDDPCFTTRQNYMRCMEERRKHPVTPQEAAAAMSPMTAPKPCEMELAMHANCVSLQLERTQKLGVKYWTQGGEDKCGVTRKNYERCMHGIEAGETDHWRLGPGHLSRELESNISHIQVNLDHK